jgi:hypothetical protein
MRTWLWTLGLAFLLATLTACAVVISPPVAPIEIRNLNFQTNFQDVNTGAYVICDNLETRLVYSFEYSGYLEAWESALVGRQTGERKARVRRATSEPFSGPDFRFIDFTYVLLPGSAPLALGSLGNEELEVASIIVEPIPGSGSRVELTVNGPGGYQRTFVSRYFPVVSHC